MAILSSTNLTYTEPVGKKGQLQFSYAPSYSNNNADQKTFQYDAADEKYSDFDSTQSNEFDNIVKTQSGGITYRLAIAGIINLQWGLIFSKQNWKATANFQLLRLSIKHSVIFYPACNWSRKISAKSSFRLFYRASTNDSVC